LQHLSRLSPAIRYTPPRKRMGEASRDQDVSRSEERQEPSGENSGGELPIEIILARHGRPDLQYPERLTPRQMKDWIKPYNQADIIVGEIPSATLNKASESGVIVSSTLRRCVQSAEKLARNRAFAAEEVFCEADLPLPEWHFPRLPVGVWGVLFRLAWFCGFFVNAEPLAQATARARNAAERLIELARENGSVFLVGHGVMNLLIAGQISALGWCGPMRPAGRYWQFSVYHAPS